MNLEAAREIARQVRLRALSGLLVIDFLAMKPPEQRRDVVATLKTALRDDPEPARVFPMAPSGLVELTRRRGRPALHEILTKPCGIADGGRIKDPVTLAYDVLRRLVAEVSAAPDRTFGIAAAPDVVAALQGPAAGALAHLQQRLGRKFAIEEAAVHFEPARITVVK